MKELSSFPNICPGVGLMDHMVTPFSVFEETFILFSIVTLLIYIHINSVGGYPFPQAPSTIYFCRLFDGSHFDWCDMIPHCSFELHFSNYYFIHCLNYLKTYRPSYIVNISEIYFNNLKERFVMQLNAKSSEYTVT